MPRFASHILLAVFATFALAILGGTLEGCATRIPRDPATAGQPCPHCKHPDAHLLLESARYLDRGDFTLDP